MFIKIINNKKIVFLILALFFVFLFFFYSNIDNSIQRDKSLKQLVTVPDPNVILNYPNKFLPIQYLKYIESGLWKEGDIPEGKFSNPFIVELQPKTGKSEISLIAVGDIMSNADLQLTAYLHKNDKGETAGGYDWILKPIKNYLETPDLTIGNLETPIAPMLPYVGSNKKFNASPFLLKGLKNAGFDILEVANNHAFDEGELGLLATIKEIKKQSLSYIGASDNFNNRNFVDLINCKGFKIALLNFTLKLNEKDLTPKNLYYIPNTPDKEKIILANIEKARKMGAEFIIIFIHWGREYHKMPMIKDRNLALNLCLQGADMIIGSHPHVIQPMEIVYTKNNTIIPKFEQGAKEHLIAYSLGNFITHQRGMAKFGMMLNFKLLKNKDGVFLAEVNPLIIESIIGNDENTYQDYVYTYNTFRPYLTTLNHFKEYINKSKKSK